MKIICDTHVLVFYAEGSDRLTAIAHNAALITADAKLQKITRLNCIW